MIFSEKSIQKSLYKYFMNRGGSIFCTNTYLDSPWESDFVSINTKGDLYECEVKISKSDFKSDFTKKKKHRLLSKAYLNISRGRTPKINNCPTYFYYSVPEGLVQPEEVPRYAGLIYITGEGKVKVVKRARKLNYHNHLTKKLLLILARNMGHRLIKKL